MEKSEPIQLSTWEENHTLLKTVSDSLALENSVEKVLLTEQAVTWLIQVQFGTAEAIF